MMSNAVFDTLTATTADNKVVPFLAQSVEPATDDFKSWTLTLRPNITFHDGTPLNADAIIVNFEAQRNDPLVGLAVRPFFPEENAIQKIDDMTVQFNLLDSNAYFPATISGQLGMVASPTWLEAAKADPTLNQNPVGTGPFKFDSRSARLGHPVRAQRRLVERRRLPRRRRVLPGARFRDPGRPHARR